MERPKFESKTPGQVLLENLAPRAGTTVRLTKRSAEQASAIQSGRSFVGRLQSDLKIGEPIILDNGTETTSVQSAAYENGIFTLRTRTSIYELAETEEGAPSASSSKGAEKISVEHQRKLTDARNALQAVLKSISPGKLQEISSAVTFDLLQGFKGDVDRYVRVLMEQYERRGIADWGAFQVAVDMERMKKELENYI